MQKYSQDRHSSMSTYPNREMSLGLLTPISFELQLLKLAVRGRKVFEGTWNKNATIGEQVMFLEILQEIKLWENDGCSKLLLERARNLVVRMKDHRSLHQQALVVYRDLLNLRNSRTCTADCSSFQNREGGNTDFPGSLTRHRNKVSDPSLV